MPTLLVLSHSSSSAGIKLSPREHSWGRLIAGLQFVSCLYPIAHEHSLLIERAQDFRRRCTSRVSRPCLNCPIAGSSTAQASQRRDDRRYNKARLVAERSSQALASCCLARSSERRNIASAAPRPVLSPPETKWHASALSSSGAHQISSFVCTRAKAAGPTNPLSKHLHIVPVFGTAALNVSPRVGHLHVTV